MRRGVRFGVFDLDLTTCELRKSGVRMRLPNQSGEILRLLVEQPDIVVTREQIQRRLWPNGEVVEYEHSINTAIARLSHPASCTSLFQVSLHRHLERIGMLAWLDGRKFYFKRLRRLLPLHGCL